MDANFLTSLITRLIRVPSAMRNAIVMIEPEHFDSQNEPQYALLWRAVRYCMEKTGGLEYHSLRDAVLLKAAELPNFPPLLLQDLVNENPQVPGLLLWAFYMSPPNLAQDVEITTAMLTRFLEERHVYQPMARALAAANGMVPKNLDQLLSDAAARQRRILEVGVNPVSGALPATWGEDSPEIIPTGLPFMDRFMDGGTMVGEVNGILGPMGVGKTTLAVNVAVAGASVVLQRNIQQNGQYARIYIGTYEQSRTEIQKKLVSCAAGIQSESVNRLFRYGPDALTSTRNKNFLPYEMAEHNRRNATAIAAGRQVEMTGELERLHANNLIFKDVVRIIDLSGMLPSSRSGVGYVEELAALIEADQREAGNPGVFTVLVDYVLLAAKRYMADRSLDESKHTRHVVSNFVDRSKQQISGRMKTNTWLLHQFNNEGNKGDPTRLTSHTQAAESAAFAAALSFCACLGTKDKETNTCLMNYSKRRRAGEYVEPQILHIRGEMSRMEDGNNDFVINPSKGRIMRRDLHERFNGGPSEPTVRPHEASPVGHIQNAIMGGAV